MSLSVITWNLYHGRDAPPDRSLRSLRSRLLRSSERNETHIQVNRGLFHEFARVLAAAEWDVALLQECPPAWAERLGVECGAQPHRVLTSRNSLAPLRQALTLLNPDLIASGEGGSNLTLIRPSAAESTGALIAERLQLVIQERKPERRTMAFTRLVNGLCIANLHTTNDKPELSRDEIRLAARTAGDWAGDAPLILGGDLNLRPDAHQRFFRELEDAHGLGPALPADSIDHVMARGLDLIDGPRAWEHSRHEVTDKDAGLAIRLSDHAPVEATFSSP